MVALLLIALAAGPKGQIAVAISENSPQPFTQALASELSALGWKVAGEGAPASVRGWAQDGAGHLRLVDNITGDVMLRHGGADVKAIARDVDQALAAWAQKGAPLSITLDGLAGFDEAEWLKEAIGKLNGVSELHEGEFGEGRQQLQVRYAGAIRDLALAIASMRPPMEITAVSPGHVGATCASLRGAKVTVAGDGPFADAVRTTLTGANAKLADDGPWSVSVSDTKFTLVERATGI